MRVPRQKCKWKVFTIRLENCEKSAIKNSIEKTILLDFLNLSTTLLTFINLFSLCSRLISPSLHFFRSYLKEFVGKVIKETLLLMTSAFKVGRVGIH